MNEDAKSQRGRNAERRGRWAESLCLLRLRITGWHIIAHRLAHRRGSGLGEIDIVARRGPVLAFIEVKARGTEQSALESITTSQRKRIQDAAAQFLAHRPEYSNYEIRFDAMILSQGLWPRHVVDAWRVY